MKHTFLTLLFVLLAVASGARSKKKTVVPQTWPDGTVMEAFFSDTSRVNIESLGQRYVVTDYGASLDSTIVQTKALQAVIDRAAAAGGGVVVIPHGTFLSGALFFKPGTHLYIEEGGSLKGSDRIKHFPVVKTRMEGQTLNYFAALVNADGCNGFTIAGPGTINGNGRAYWEEFWIRRQYNRQCTNLEALRPRLVYISNSSNVTVQDVHLINSPFWTNHLYRCDHVRYLYATIYAPHEPQQAKAPSSDAIDLDVCHDVLVHGCDISVNDDAVVLKGGKGTWADKNPDNGPCRNILVQKCHYGFVHGCLTLGSESLDDRNVVLRQCQVDDASRVLWLKMRPDTPQQYTYVTVADMQGTCGSFLVVRPWTQFFKPEQRDDMPLSTCANITLQDIRMDCKNFFDVGGSDKYRLVDFTFRNINVSDKAKKPAFSERPIENLVLDNVSINGQQVK